MTIKTGCEGFDLAARFCGIKIGVATSPVQRSVVVRPHHETMDEDGRCFGHGWLQLYDLDAGVHTLVRRQVCSLVDAFGPCYLYAFFSSDGTRRVTHGYVLTKLDNTPLLYFSTQEGSAAQNEAVIKGVLDALRTAPRVGSPAPQTSFDAADDAFWNALPETM